MSESQDNLVIIGVAVGVGSMVIVAVIVLVILLYRKKRLEKPPMRRLHSVDTNGTVSSRSHKTDVTSVSRETQTAADSVFSKRYPASSSLMPDILVPLHHTSNPFVHHVKVNGQPLPNPSSNSPALVPFRSSQLPASNTCFTHDGRIRMENESSRRTMDVSNPEGKVHTLERQLSNGRYQIPRARTNSDTSSYSYSQSQSSKYESNWSSRKYSYTGDSDLSENPVYVFSGQRVLERRPSQDMGPQPTRSYKYPAPLPPSEPSSTDVAWDSFSKSAITKYDFERYSRIPRLTIRQSSVEGSFKC